MAILAAGALVGMVARGNSTREAMVGAHEISDAEAARLREAMRKLDEDESPDW